MLKLLLVIIFGKSNFDKWNFLDVLWIPAWTKTHIFPLNLVIMLWSKKLEIVCNINKEYIEKRFIHEADNIFPKENRKFPQFWI